jgi:hypothetical protein
MSGQGFMAYQITMLEIFDKVMDSALAVLRIVSKDAEGRI